MPSCAAWNCSRQDCREERKKGFSFHKFPHKNPRLCQIWIQNLKLKDYKPSTKAVLCSAHFQEEYFDRTGQTVRLKSGAIPSIFSFPSHLQKTVPKQRHPLSSSDACETGYDNSIFASGSCIQEASTDIQTDACRDLTQPKSVHTAATDHAYATMLSPKKLKRKLDELVDIAEELRKKLKTSGQKTRRLRSKVTSLN